MKRSTVKTKRIRIGAKSAANGRILEMRPVRGRGYSPFAILMLFAAVIGITVATLSFKRMSEAIIFADKTSDALAAAISHAVDLEGRVTDLETLQTLASKKIEPLAVSPDQTWLTYSSKNLTLRYPASFEIVKASEDFPALAIKGAAARIEIFRMKDFGSKRVVEEGAELPKESLLVGAAPEDSRIQPFDAWLYYGAGDETAKATLEAVAASVTAIK